MNPSVAMASYNGEKYIYEQMLSIINQLDEDDEFIISDDGSADGTIGIIKKLMCTYPQIKLIDGPHKGVFCNFENAMLHCKNDIIFLSDQDDIWINGKVSKIKEMFSENTNTNIIMHRAYIMKDDEKTEDVMVHFRQGFFRNLVKSCYWGCCMAMRKTFIEQYIPFDIDGTAHDQLIGLLGEKHKCVMYLDVPLCYHRYHNNNETRKLPLISRVRFRTSLLRDYLLCEAKLKKNRE